MYALAGKRVWVAGHRGMVGAALVRRLGREGCTVLTVGRDQLDLRDQAGVARWIAAQRPDAVFLAAATVGGIVANDTRPVDFLLDNLLIETAVIAGAHAGGVEKLLFLGSSCIYPRDAAQPIGEEALLTGPLEPTNQWYAIAKIAGIKLTQAYRRQHGARFISAMPTNLYGPGDNYSPLGSHVMPALIRKVAAAKRDGGSVVVWGTGTPRREFLFVDDCADACVHLMQHYDGDDPINVGTGRDIAIGDLTRLVMEVIGCDAPIEHDLSKPDGTPRKLLDVSRLAALGWRATTPLRDGIAAAYADFPREWRGVTEPSDRRLRIAVSDYPGHAFPAQLSRALARRGHQVLHLSFSDFQSPKGRVAADPGDPPGLTVATVGTERPFAKNSFLRRRRQEAEVGRKLGEAIVAFGPDLILSGNAPLDTQAGVERTARRLGVPYLFWMQDVYSDAIRRILIGRYGVAGRLVGAVYRRIEGRLLRRAAHVVVIADAFVPAVRALAGAMAPPLTVIENWAPLEDLPLLPRDNDWARVHLPAAPVRLVYSGTLGFKHNPDLIAAIARATDIQVDVFSEGPAADHLRAVGAREGLANLTVHGWVGVDDLPNALASADILLAILEPDAGEFSVPSKVLSYLAAGRAILGAIPGNNLAARLITGNAAGLVVDPGDPTALIAAARRIADDAAFREAAGRRSRAYAERAFAIDTITDKFETVFAAALADDTRNARG